MIKTVILIIIMLIQVISLIILSIWTLSTFLHKQITNKVNLVKRVIKKNLPLLLIDIVVFSIILYKLNYSLFLIIEILVITIATIINIVAIKKNKVIDTIFKNKKTK